MRIGFQRELERLRAELGRMCALAGSTARHATRAVLDTDPGAAQAALADVRRSSVIRERIERKALSLLALQAPVAGDLRVVVTSIRIATDAERMGRLGAHVAESCLRHEPACAIPVELHPVFTAMGGLAVEVAECCRVAVRTGDADQLRRIRQADLEMERWHGAIFETVSAASWAHRPMVAADVVLLGRFYGRFADLAEDIARRVSFQSTGEQELTVASMTASPSVVGRASAGR